MILVVNKHVGGQVYTPATAGVLDGAAFSTFLTNQYAAKSTTGDSLRQDSVFSPMCSQPIMSSCATALPQGAI